MSLSAFAIFFAISPMREHEKTVYSQAVHLLQKVEVDSENGLIVIMVGELYVDDKFNVYKIDSIRMTHTGEKYIVSTSKNIFDFKTINDFYKTPYNRSKINQADSFVIDKRKITITEIITIYSERLTSFPIL